MSSEVPSKISTTSTGAINNNNNISSNNNNNNSVATASGRGRANSLATGSGGGTVNAGPSTTSNHYQNAVHMSKADEIEIQVVDQNTEQPEVKRTSLGWICCAPCIWLRTSTTVHKIALSTATLLVTSLLVASPILFLISTAPSQLPRDCYRQDDDDCLSTPAPPPECSEIECRTAATSIQAHMNWKVEPCTDFKAYSCAPVHSSLRAVKSAQERAYIQMQQLLIQNTTAGPFRKLGRMYGSCLRQKFNSSTIKLFLDELGGYLPVGALGPSSIAGLVTKIKNLGPVPLLDIYYDLSYGKNPQIVLIIDGPNTSPYVLENSVRWLGPKAPPYTIQSEIPNLLNAILDEFLPAKLAADVKSSEKETIVKFISELNQIRKYYVLKDFSNSYVMNLTSLNSTYSFLNWNELISPNWSGPIVVRSTDYFNKLRALLNQYQTRVVHNSLLVLFALNALPSSTPSPEVCTKATMWALPEVTSALYIAQFTDEQMSDVIERTETIFDSLKAHLKRAPSLRGTALVKLSALKMQAHPWPTLFNLTILIQNLETLEISSDNWFENVIKIYKLRKADIQLAWPTEVQTAYAYPPISKPFYDSLSHSIVVPLSLMVVPYFDQKLPSYMHYSTIGVSLGREILRSITKAFDDKAMRCVPPSIDVFSNSSRMEILIYSGGMQIAYHSLLSLTGPLKGVNRLPGLSLTPQQIFFLLVAQEFCIESEYLGIETKTADFNDILMWLIAQGGSANEVFHCIPGNPLRIQKTCSVL